MPDSQKPSTGTPSPAEVKDKAQNVAGQAKEAAQPYIDKAQQVAGQAKEQYGNAREQALKGYRQAEGTIARNPAPAMLIGFGVGFGLGVVLCSLLTKKEETWTEKYLPESLQNVPDQYQSLVSTLKGLPKTVQSQLPKSVSKYLS